VSELNKADNSVRKRFVYPIILVRGLAGVTILTTFNPCLERCCSVRHSNCYSCVHQSGLRSSIEVNGLTQTRLNQFHKWRFAEHRDGFPLDGNRVRDRLLAVLDV
jgi:hypothetical protein